MFIIILKASTQRQSKIPAILEMLVFPRKLRYYCAHKLQQMVVERMKPQPVEYGCECMIASFAKLEKHFLPQHQLITYQNMAGGGL